MYEQRPCQRLHARSKHLLRSLRSNQRGETMQYPHVQRSADAVFRASFPDFPVSMLRAIRSKSGSATRQKLWN
jgi:hypothetical protein